MSTDPKDVSGALDPEACWHVLERTATSPALKRAARLKEFLLYVGAKSLKEARTGIHEQEIGEAVFGRPDAYDTSQDNIVRVSATELRKRVEAYFASDGHDESIVFDIPRGSYMPVFRLRAAAQHSAPPAIAEPAAAPQIHAAPPTPWRRFQFAVVCVLAILLGIACLLLWRQNRALMRRMKSPTPQATAAPPSPPCKASGASCVKQDG